MIINIYSIKDVKVGHMQPFYQANDAVAVRSIKNAVNSDQINNIKQNMDDMELWKIGEFNDENGAIKPDLKFICKATDLKEGE